MRDCIAILLITATLCTFALAQVSPSKGQNRLADRHLTEHGSICEDCHSEENPSGSPKKELCLDCHGSYEDLAKLTHGDEANPHDSHNGAVSCDSCHKSHMKSILFCDECHGWGLETP